MKRTDKESLIAGIIVGTVVVAVFGALIYFTASAKQGTAQTSQSAANSMADHHGGGSPAGSSPVASLSELMDKPVPSFSLKDKNGNQYSPENLRGKNIVLFFNEGLMCYPACWNQIVALAKDNQLKRDDTVVLSVVVDSPQDWRRAVEKMPELAEATVVFDEGAEVSKKLGMLWTKSSMHYGSLPGHTYMIINKDGIVKHVFDDPNMAIHNGQLVEELARI